MFMIILAHSGAPEEYTWLYNPFFLSAFFFVSGYTFRPMQNAKEFVIHKLKGQVYPFAVFGFINAVMAVLVEHDSWIDRLQFLISRNRIWDDMWFIACLWQRSSSSTSSICPKSSKRLTERQSITI